MRWYTHQAFAINQPVGVRVYMSCPYVPWYFQILRVLCVISMLAILSAVVVGGLTLLFVYLSIPRELLALGMIISAGCGIQGFMWTLDICQAGMWYRHPKQPSTPDPADPE